MSSGSHRSLNSNSYIVEKILEQGQRLRNSLVETILNNDPFSRELGSSVHLTDRNVLGDRQGGDCSSKAIDKKLISDYLNGEKMSCEDEKRALEHLRANPNLIPVDFDNTKMKECMCDICRSYRSHITVEEHGSAASTYSSIDDKKCLEDVEINTKLQGILKQVDSLKVKVHNLRIKQTGINKILSNDKNSGVGNATYFVEYNIPTLLIGNVAKTKAKVNSGLSPNKTVRFCSKRFHNDAITFHQSSVHSIANIHNINLNDLDIEFSINYRPLKDRAATHFGSGRFNLGFLNSNNLTSYQELVITNADKTITLGYLTVTVQLGRDKLYFGKNFIDGVTSEKENKILPLDLSVCNDTPRTKSSKTLIKKPATPASLVSIKSSPRSIVEENTQVLYGLIYISEARYYTNPINSYIVCYTFHKDDTASSKVVYDSVNPVFNLHQIVPVLYNEEFLEQMRDNFIVVEFWERDGKDSLLGIAKLSLHQFYIAYRNPVVTKHLVNNEFPIIGVDWWEPITNPSSSVDCGEIQALVALGTESQIQNLKNSRGFKEQHVTAKTTPKQSLKKAQNTLGSKINRNIGIDNYYKTLNRIDKSDKVVKKIGGSLNAKRSLREINSDKSHIEDNRNRTITINKDDNDHLPLIQTSPVRHIRHDVEEVESLHNKSLEVRPVTISSQTLQDIQSKCVRLDKSTQSVEKIDKGVQFEEMESQHSSYKLPSKKDMLNSFLEELCAYNQEHRENVTTATQSTNTQECTSQAAQTNVPPVNSLIPSDRLFKIHVVVEQALHLPLKKKCRSKRSKGKHGKYEEILPSCYVSFEGKDEKDVVTTPIVNRSVDPKWDFRCDVTLPVDLLLNNNKRLIFKVWRKGNKPSASPDFSSDAAVGFAAVDLTVLLAGLPMVNGWFNIIDFSSKCNGQIKISVTPLEDISKYKRPTENAPPTPSSPLSGPSDPMPSELLSRALKRKFTELDEITERLKLRLSNVTNDDSDVSNDDFVDQFEKDLNTVCVEDSCDSLSDGGESCSPPKKFSDLVNEKLTAFMETRELEEPPPAQNLPTFDTHLIQGKMRIDSLLEKLSLLTGANSDSASSRYISGCSTNLDAENRILDDRPQCVETNNDFSVVPEASTSSSSTTDFLHDFHSNLLRQAPDGAGIEKKSP